MSCTNEHVHIFPKYVRMSVCAYVSRCVCVCFQVHENVGAHENMILKHANMFVCRFMYIWGCFCVNVFVYV